MNCLKYLVEDTYNKIQDFFIYIIEIYVAYLTLYVVTRVFVLNVFLFSTSYTYFMVMESEIMFSSFEKVDATRLATRVL